MRFLNDIWALNLNFNSAATLIKECCVVWLNDSAWANRTCACYYFFKKYICCHIVAVSINLNIVTIPVEYRDTVDWSEGKKR